MWTQIEQPRHLFHTILKEKSWSASTKSAVLVSGRQSSGTYVLNGKCYINSNGEVIDDETSQNVWLKCEILFESDKIIMDDVTANVVLPLSTAPALCFFYCLKNCLKHNFLPGLLVVSGVLMEFPYRHIIQQYGGCALCHNNCYGTFWDMEIHCNKGCIVTVWMLSQ